MCRGEGRRIFPRNMGEPKQRWTTLVPLILAMTACGGSTASNGSGGGSGGGSGAGGGTGGGSGTGGGTGVNLPAPKAPVTGARETWSGYSYVVPPGMTAQTYADGVVLTDRTDATCTISLLPQRAAEADATQQALSILLSWSPGTITGFHDEFGGLTPLDHKRRGVNGEGFSYVLLQGYLLGANGAELSGGRIMLVNLGAMVAPIIGVGGSTCFDDATGKRLDWSWLYYSLQFPGATPTGTPAPADQLVGKWFINSGTIFLGETYAANGHYASVSAYQTYTQVTPTQVLEHTSTFTGDGTYEVHQDRLSRLSASRPAETTLFRIVDEQNASVASGWLPRFYQLDLATDATPYEYSLVRDTQ